MINIEDDKVYYVGFSDGSKNKGIHYVCMKSEDEEVTKEWCKEVQKKYPECNITYLKMTGKLLEEFKKAYSLEYDRLNGEI